MGRRKVNPQDFVGDDLKWREWVTYKLGQHDMALRILLALSSATLGLLLLLLKLLL